MRKYTKTANWSYSLRLLGQEYRRALLCGYLLKNKKISYWLDRDQIKPGDSITQRIEYGVQNSPVILLCISKNQLQSGWSRAEYTGILHDILSKKTTKKIIPIIIDDIDETKPQDIPLLIKDTRHIDFNSKKA